MTVFDGAEAVYGLTPMQEAMLLYSRAGSAGTFVGQLTCRLIGPLDPQALRRAFDGLVRRHTALRTAFATEGLDRPLQVVKSTAPIPFDERDWSDLPEDARARNEAGFLADDLEQRFDLQTAPLMRVTLIRIAPDEHLLVWTRHHVLMDGWSMALSIDELAALYAAEAGGRSADLPKPRPFQDYVDWMARRDGDQDAAFWRDRMRAVDATTPLLRPDDGRPATDAPLVEQARGLGPERAERLRRASERHGVTEAALLTAAWALVVARHNDVDRAVFGLTAAGRPDDMPGVESTVGLFLNTVPLAIELPPERTLGVWLAEVAETVAAVNAHAHVPMAQIRPLSGVPADRPLFDHILVLEGTSMSAAPDRFADLAVRDYRFIDQTNFDLNVGVQLGTPATMLVVHNPNRIDEDRARALGDSFEAAIDAVTAEEDRCLGQIGVAGPAHLAFLSERFNATDAPEIGTPEIGTPEIGTVDLLARIAGQDPTLPALVGDGETVSYGALWSAAGALAETLAAKGVGAEDVVALVLKREALLPLAVLGAMRAGAVYLPLDPDDPPARLAALMAEAGVTLAVTSADLADRFPAAAAPVIALDRNDLARNDLDRTPAGAGPVPSPDPDAAAYAIFTSGSTGRPKAVVNTWGGLANRIAWMQRAYPIGPADRVLHKTPVTFDVSVWELIWPLTEGAAMVLAAPGGHRDPEYLRDLIVAQGVTVCHFVPSMLRAFLAAEDVERCRSLTRLLCSGEALSGADRDRVHARLGARLHNLYGPAEAAIDVSFHDCDRNETTSDVPIGRPIANTRLHLLDRHLLPVPPAVPGEIHIAGANVARGYLGRPALTAERFVPDPLSPIPGARLYRTGDLARLDAAGELAYLGRRDFQVKLRGMRIELGEIDAVLRTVDGVREAAVVAVADDTGQHLAAHLAVAESADRASIRARAVEVLRSRLPEAMVPGSFAFHETFPVSANGKLDRRKLIATEAAPALPAATVPPRTDEERRIAAIWQEVLRLDEVGVTQDFFELGGHSLLLVQVAARLREAFDVEISMRALFNARTVEAMLDVVLEAELAELDPEEKAAMLAEMTR